MEDIIQIFKALGDETRLKVLIILSQRNICAKGIAKHLGVSEPAISQHLKVLREAGIVVGEKRGYFVHYNIQNQRFLQVNQFIDDLLNSNGHFGFNIPNNCKLDCSANGSRCCQRRS